MQPILKERGAELHLSEVGECLHKFFGILLHRRHISSPLFINF